MAGWVFLHGALLEAPMADGARDVDRRTAGRSKKRKTRQWGGVGVSEHGVECGAFKPGVGAGIFRRSTGLVWLLPDRPSDDLGGGLWQAGGLPEQLRELRMYPEVAEAEEVQDLQTEKGDAVEACRSERGLEREEFG